jgi:tripartite-type tricarboxylate transporter receptor subunit TctC
VIFFDVMGIPLVRMAGRLRGARGASVYCVRVYCAARKKDDSIKERSREDAMVFRALAASAALILSMLGPAGNAAAEGYPAKPVRLIVPFAAGGPTDVIARIVAQKLSESFGQQVVTENIPGAGGNTGVTMVARAPADGYTILVVSTGFIVNPSMYAKISYDPVKDFAPITLVAASPNVISVNPDFPAKSMRELVDLVKANPGKYSFAQPATGSTPHLAGELFKQKYALDLVTVPFNGAALAVNSTIGGHTPIAFTALPPAMSNIKEGKLRGLAVLASKRSPALPDVPTNGEAGVPDLESDTLTGIVAPAGTPKEVIERWRNDIVKMVATPEVNQRLEALGFAPVANTPDEFGARIKSEIAKWGKVVRDANIRAD